MFFFGGDFRFFYPQNIKDFVTFPSAWDSSLNTGIGQNQLSSLWITGYFNFTALFTKLGLSWNLIQIIFWILPALVVSFLSSFFLFKYFFNDKKYSILSAVIYSLNTYFLLVLTGGQLGVSLAYSLVPLVFLRFAKLLKTPNIKNSLLEGLVISLQILFDPRIFYITLLILFIYSIFNLSEIRAVKNKLFLLKPFLVAVLLNIFWILPLILTRSSVIPSGFDSASSFKFFSFADFSHALSLLHPNWPENIFGKIYFLDPKFLILPILAFSSLLFTKNKNVLYFVFISLLGIFLAKGANPPFGQINIFLFEHFPGMSMFRDPTKFYILVALAYSILIPFSLNELSKYIQSKTRISVFNLEFGKIVILFFILYFFFLISPIAQRTRLQKVPQDYVLLANFLDNQKNFFRTLWIPKWQRFGYFSNTHPAIGREELYKGSAKQQISRLNENLLEDLSVKYIVIPYDSESEIFLKDRKYNSKEYTDAINHIKKIPWLKELEGFGNVKVFELSMPRDHFWSPSKELKIGYKIINPDEYQVQLEGAKKEDVLVFSEGFDKNWDAYNSHVATQSSRFDGVINSFVLSQDGDYKLKIQYKPQRYLEAGGIVSFASLLILLSLFAFGKNFKKW